LGTATIRSWLHKGETATSGNGVVRRAHKAKPSWSMPLVRRHALLTPVLSIAPTLSAAVAHAQEVTPEEAHDPLTQLRGMTFQNNVDFGVGEDDRTGYQLLLQPWHAEVGTGAWLRLRNIAGLPLIYRPGLSPLTKRGYGVYQIGEVYARS